MKVIILSLQYIDKTSIEHKVIQRNPYSSNNENKYIPIAEVLRKSIVHLHSYIRERIQRSQN